MGQRSTPAFLARSLEHTQVPSNTRTFQMPEYTILISAGIKLEGGKK